MLLLLLLLTDVVSVVYSSRLTGVKTRNPHYTTVFIGPSSEDGEVGV
jgi:hypothetical protein